ncbi:MAG: CheR family methyltransferase, partial [Pseudomonadota bacterium]
VAILLVEQMSRMSAPPTVNVFATDIDPTMLSVARGGIYPQSAVKDIPPELLERYFIAEEKGYRVTPRIRDMVRFSEHSLIKDPPFSKLDLICCRNLLIYFENDLQSRVIPLFHYALRKDGVLFLGPSENLAGHDRLFAPISSKHRVFKRNNSATRPMPLPLGANGGDRSNHARGERRAMHDAALALDEDLVRRRVVERYAPPFVLVNTEGEVVFASGRTGRYLEFTSGKPSMRILDLAKEGLRSAIRAVLSSSASNTKRVVKRDVRLDLEGQNVTVDVLAEPIDSQTHLIVFQNTTDVTTDQYQDFGVEVTQFTDDMRIRELEDELQEARQSLRSTVEELETSNEELKSSNEEMMSMNEELQSANEELSTINDELKSKIDALAEAKDDMQNFLDSTRLASVFLDSDLKIRSFTPTAAEMLGVADVDVSRSISDLRTRADSDLLEQIAQRVLSTLEPYEGPVQVESTDRKYSLRALPYRTAEDEIKGVVLVFVDVTDLTRAAYALDLARADAEERLIEVEQIYRQTPVAMGLLDAQKRYLRLNDKLAEINGQPLQAMLGKTTGEVVPEIALLVDDLIDQVLQTGEPIIGAEVVGPTPAEPGQDKVFLSDWYPYFVEDQVTAVGVVVQDVTETRAREKQVNFLMHELQHRVKNILANVMALARQAKRSAHPPDVALERLNDRLQSMAQTNNLLALRDWRSADLRALLEAELVAVYGEDRVHLVGPEIVLNSKATLSFAMGLHEMATNAAKYGALSVETGRVEVTWLTEDRGEGPMLLLHWVEVKGPGVTEPKDVGFGSSLVTMCFEQSLEGTVDRRFDPNGVTYTLRVPLAQACFEPGEGDANNVHSDRGGRSSGRARPRADA